MTTDGSELKRPSHLRLVSPETEARMRELIENPELRRYLMHSDFDEDPWGAASFELACQSYHDILSGEYE